MTVDKFEVPIECREANYDGPGRIVGTILETGRVASDRREMMTPDDLRSALGADAALAGRVASIHAACTARINRYAPGAPDAVATEALVLYAAWIYQSGAQRRSVFPEEGSPTNVARAFLLSGAQGLLSSWRRPRAGACR